MSTRPDEALEPSRFCFQLEDHLEILEEDMVVERRTAGPGSPVRNCGTGSLPVDVESSSSTSSSAFALSCSCRYACSRGEQSLSSNVVDDVSSTVVAGVQQITDFFRKWKRFAMDDDLHAFLHNEQEDPGKQRPAS